MRGLLLNDVPRRGSVRAGFTLIEVLVTVTVIAIIIAILFPALGMARNAARDASCKANLRELFIGVSRYSDTHEKFCSGAWDWQRDGCFTEVGWVADQVALGTPVGQLLCPASPYQLHMVYGQMLTLDAADNPCAKSEGLPPTTQSDGTQVVNACRQISAASGVDDKLELMHELVYDQHYNTNYVASWFLVRGEADIDRTTGLLKNRSGSITDCPTSITARYCADGGLDKRRVGVTAAAPNAIPLFGCGNGLPAEQSIFPHQLGEHFKGGAQMCESYTRGPVDRTTMVAPEMSGTATGTARWFGPWNDTLQDYRNFGPVHGNKNGHCNFVFLDGSVKSFRDTDDDKFLNNGFEPSSLNGFATNTEELPHAQFFSGWSLDKSRIGH